MAGEINWFFTVLAAVFGLFAGSFLNVLIYRLPRGEQLAGGRSRCPACGHALAWFDLVPVLSFLLLQGRCRHCLARISLRYPLVELLTGAVFATLFLRFGLTPALVKYLFLGAVLIAASFIDLEHYLIPDRLVLAGFLGGVVLGVLACDVGILSSLLGAAVSGGVLLLIAVFSRGGMGGGDIKLAAVTGLFLGWPLGPLGLFGGACLGGLAGILLLLFKLKGRKDPIPFGPFIALGSLLSLLWGREFLAWYFGHFG
ncbi:MAG: prepilin peptidase [Bacillota bacterium]